MEVADFRSGYGFVLTCSISKVGSITGSLTQLRMMQPGGRWPPLWACERMVHLQNQTYCQGQDDIIIVVVVVIIIVIVVVLLLIIIIIIIIIITISSPSSSPSSSPLSFDEKNQQIHQPWRKMVSAEAGENYWRITGIWRLFHMA